MNILQLVPRLDIGGVETGTIDLARYLTLNGHKAVVISGGGKLVKKLDEVGARHFLLPVGSKNPITMACMVFKIAKIIKKENIDLVHARSRVPALLGFIASKITLKTFITTAHGQYKKHLLSYVMGWGKLVIAANSIMARYMIDNFNVRPDKIRIVPRGVDIKKFKFVLPDDRIHKDFRIGMISRITPLKGHLDFIKAASLLSRSVNNLKVYIVGNFKTAKPGYLRELEILIKRLSLKSIVRLTDETHDVPSILGQLDVLVSANRQQEAFGRIIIEAQSSGVPSVATRVGGVVDLIEDSSTGLLCEPSNPQDMAEKIYTLYKDDRLREKIAKNARILVEKKYSIEIMMQSTLRVYEEAKNSFRILIIKISALGDVILSIPSIRAIRAKYPKATIKVLTGLRMRDILKNLPFIDDLIICDFEERDKGLKGFLRVAEALRKEDFDMTVDFQNNKKSHVLSFLTFAAFRYGYANGKLSFFINRKVKNDKSAIGPIEHQMKVLRLLGIYEIDKALSLFPTEEEKTWAVDFLKNSWVNLSKPIILFNMEASPRWVTKKWPAENFATLSEMLAKKLSTRVVVIGQNPSDHNNQRFFELTAKWKPINAVGKTHIGQLIALIGMSNILITSDSAPMHIAAACKKPFITFFGPTDPKRHLPPAEIYRLMFKNMKCSPCYKTHCDKKTTCMNAITVNEVFNAAKELLAA